MDSNTNPKPSNRFPLVSYVMSRFHPSFKISSPSLDPADLENPLPPSAGDEMELVARMPRLDDPALLASMASALSEITQARSVLQALGDRPDHEAVDAARARVAEIDAALADGDGGLDEIVVDDDAGLAERGREARNRAEEERAGLLAVVRLDEMHEAFEKLLREAEVRLVKMYEASGGGDGGGDGGDQEVTEEDEKVKEEVIGILQAALTKSLERVDLSHRDLRILPEAFGTVRGLVYLNLSNNLLEVIPDAIAGLECLEELRLSSNILVSLPDSIGLLSNLKILDVSGNKLKALPNSISKCRSLVELNVSYNEITYLPTNIGYELQNLEKLWIHLNKIRSLPTSICEMRSLRLLDAHFNQLHGLPYAFGKLTNLETLNLSSNFSDMQELPATFCDLFNLRELDLSNNQIHVLPDSFGRLENLTKLNLDQNPIVVPPAEVVNDGVAAVKEYMTKRLVDILLEEKRKSMAAEDSPNTPTAWLTRSTSWLGNWVTGVLGAGEKSNKDSFLDQQL